MRATSGFATRQGALRGTSSVTPVATTSGRATSQLAEVEAPASEPDALLTPLIRVWGSQTVRCEALGRCGYKEKRKLITHNEMQHAKFQYIQFHFCGVLRDSFCNLLQLFLVLAHQRDVICVGLRFVSAVQQYTLTLHVVDYVNNEVLRLTSRIGDIEIQSLQVQVIRVSAFTRSVARNYVTGVFRSFIIQPHFQRDFPEVYIIISKEEVYLHFRGGIVKYHLGKTTFNTPEPDQDSNINFPVIGSLVYCESSSLDHVATEMVSYCPSHTRVNSLFIVIVDEIKVVETPPEPVRSKLELLIEEAVSLHYVLPAQDHNNMPLMIFTERLKEEISCKSGLNGISRRGGKSVVRTRKTVVLCCNTLSSVCASRLLEILDGSQGTVPVAGPTMELQLISPESSGLVSQRGVYDRSSQLKEDTVGIVPKVTTDVCRLAGRRISTKSLSFMRATVAWLKLGIPAPPSGFGYVIDTGALCDIQTRPLPIQNSRHKTKETCHEPTMACVENFKNAGYTAQKAYSKEPLSPRDALFDGRTNFIKLFHQANHSHGETIKYLNLAEASSLKGVVQKSHIVHCLARSLKKRVCCSALFLIATGGAKNYVKEMTIKLLGALNKRFKVIEENKVFAEATVLDHRFKRHGFSDPDNFERVKNDIINQVCERAIIGGTTLVAPLPVIPEQSSSSVWDEFDKNVSNLDDGTPAQMMIGFIWGKSTPDINFDAHMSVDKELAQCGVLCVESWEVQVAWQGGSGGGDYDNEAEAKPTQNFIEAHALQFINEFSQLHDQCAQEVILWSLNSEYNIPSKSTSVMFLLGLCEYLDFKLRAELEIESFVVSVVDVNNKVKVMFMKGCTKDNTVDYVDENDTPFSCDQIVGVIPTPKMILKWQSMELPCAPEPKWEHTEWIQNIYSSVELFEMFFEDQVIELIANCSNNYAFQKSDIKFKVAANYIKVFIGILLLSSYCSVPKYRMYWKTSSDTYNEAVSKAMSRNTFEDILKYLHVYDNLTLDESDQFGKCGVFNITWLFSSRGAIPRCINWEHRSRARKELKSRGHYCTETIQSNRIEKAPLEESYTLRKVRGSYYQLTYTSSGITFIRYHDNNIGLSQLVKQGGGAEKKRIQIDQPACIINNNCYMGGVDRLDQNILSYRGNMRMFPLNDQVCTSGQRHAVPLHLPVLLEGPANVLAPQRLSDTHLSTQKLYTQN
uniref:(California timema) hypothetical protein n=1 Tax=Timema californicum TaxID=61474 RepID=A0A7R9P8A2_TIMCA|nr:unnamed protein product [Timema californicum]